MFFYAPFECILTESHSETPESWNWQFQQDRIFAENFRVFADNFTYYRQFHILQTISHIADNFLTFADIYKVFADLIWELYEYMNALFSLRTRPGLKICRQI